MKKRLLYTLLSISVSTGLAQAALSAPAQEGPSASPTAGILPRLQNNKIAMVSSKKKSLSQQSVRGWFIEQHNPHTGDWTVYLSDAGMSATNQQLGCTLVTSAPNWDMTIYNERTKMYFSSPLEKWNGLSGVLHGAARDTGQQLNYPGSPVAVKPAEKVRDTAILNHKATVYRSDSLVTSGLRKLEFAVTPDVQPSAHLKQVFGKLYGVKAIKTKGLPIMVSYLDQNGKKTLVFETTKLLQIDVPANKLQFTNKANYKKVETEISVFIDEKGNNDIENILGDLGGETDNELQGVLGDNEDPRKKTNEAAALPTEDSPTSSESNQFADSWLALLLPFICICIGCGAIGWAVYRLLNIPSTKDSR